MFLASSLATADSITKRYPDYSHSKEQACSDAKLYIKNRVGKECPDGFSSPAKVSCVACTKKIRFNTPTWTCSGRAEFKCNNKSLSQSQSDEEAGYIGRKIRKTRGTLQHAPQKLGGPCLQFPNSERCAQWKRNYQKAVGGVRN